MTKGDLEVLIAQCAKNEADLNQQLQNVVAQINRTVGAREMAVHLLSGMDGPVVAAEPKAKRGRKKKVVDGASEHAVVGTVEQQEAA